MIVHLVAIRKGSCWRLLGRQFGCQRIGYNCRQGEVWYETAQGSTLGPL